MTRVKNWIPSIFGLDQHEEYLNQFNLILTSNNYATYEELLKIYNDNWNGENFQDEIQKMSLTELFIIIIKGSTKYPSNINSKLEAYEKDILDKDTCLSSSTILVEEKQKNNSINQNLNNLENCTFSLEQNNNVRTKDVVNLQNISKENSDYETFESVQSNNSKNKEQIKNFENNVVDVLNLKDCKVEMASNESFSNYGFSDGNENDYIHENFSVDMDGGIDYYNYSHDNLLTDTDKIVENCNHNNLSVDIDLNADKCENETLSIDLDINKKNFLGNLDKLEINELNTKDKNTDLSLKFISVNNPEPLMSNLHQDRKKTENTIASKNIYFLLPSIRSNEPLKFSLPVLKSSNLNFKTDDQSSSFTISPLLEKIFTELKYKNFNPFVIRKSMNVKYRINKEHLHSDLKHYLKFRIIDKISYNIFKFNIRLSNGKILSYEYIMERIRLNFGTNFFTFNDVRKIISPKKRPNTITWIDYMNDLVFDNIITLKPNPKMQKKNFYFIA